MKINKFAIAIFAATVLFSSCKKSPDTTSPDETTPTTNSLYSVWVTTAAGSSYLLTADNLMKDTLLTPNNNQGIDITSHLPAAFYAIYAYAYEGKYYLSNDGTRFSQFEVVNSKSWKETNNYAFPGNFYLGKVLKDISTKDEMVMTKTAGTTNKVKNVLEQPIYFMNINNMTINKTIGIEIPMITFNPKTPEGKDHNPYIVPTSFTQRGDKLFVGHKYRSNETRKDIIDTAYMYVCDYPSLANGKIIKDGRGGFAAGHWEVQTLTFTDDNNDLYIVTKKTDAATYGLLRIKAGQTTFDPDYFFDLKDYNVFSNNISQVQKLGDGKVYISPFVVDPANKKIVADLRILVGGGESKTTMNFMENGKLYDVFKTDESKWYVYEYDPAKNSVKRGAEIDPGITQVYHLNKLK
ncbi:DUF4374 domain-containing protein [Sphingobacterium siyangense]|jgi:hypothetical protein|uniref:DUF4374 domain-containing protein n=1 Tax=Sphingobacterium siyangense TaxID=459529 RepID=UPI0028ADBB44|nr:DUF4374 domain-containing protein [Sphingobacterium siyangense]